ncbi:DUF4189 domain-containing protein [Nocardia sp. BMG111209]|uniref:DUF4189 domain-containing protein n=1 Tax=Nocardia sp. BMG111209 TaxID=1160137 RepID=UPI0009DB97D4|nr:DUF4189 domain-containing protein [Nocardia sp. BMG111209]
MLVSGKTIAGLALGAAAVALTATAGPAAADDGHLYGAFAVSTENPDDAYIIGGARNYGSQAEADAAAMGQCHYANCWVVLRYVDGCGAISARDGRVLGALGSSKRDAENAAMGLFGPPTPSTLSSDGSQTELLDSACNG